MKPFRYGYILLACLMSLGLLWVGTMAKTEALMRLDPPLTPMPHDCDGVTPPTQPPPLCCVRGYVYRDGTSALGAMVQIESPQGVLTTTTITDSLGRIFYRASLSDTPLLARVGDWITVTGWLSGAGATKTYQVTPHGQQVDLVMRSWDDWWNPDWKYRRPLALSTGDGGHPAGYTFRLNGLPGTEMSFDDLVRAGKALSDYRDIRVVRRLPQGGWQEIPRQVSSEWDLEFQLAVPSELYTDTSYYLYYGNPDAGAALTYSIPQGYWVDMCTDHRCESGFVGTWIFNNLSITSTDICQLPLDHDERTGSSDNGGDRYRAMVYIPTSGQWAFKLYLKYDSKMSLDRSVIGEITGGNGEARWVTIRDNYYLTQGWHLMEVLHSWTTCGPFKLKMSGPDFPEQDIPPAYFRLLEDVRWDAVVLEEQSPYMHGLPIPTIHTIYPRPAVQGRDVITMIGSGVDNDEWGGSIQAYRWRTTGRILGTSAQLVISASELSVGTQVISFAVKDDEGNWSPEIATGIEIYSHNPPVAAFVISPATGRMTTTFRMDASLSHDSEDVAEVLQVRWDFENDGIFDTEWTVIKAITHSYFYSGAGVYDVRLEVQDTQGLTDAVMQSVTVTAPYSPTPWLFILYWDGDNNLNDSFQAALTRLHQMAANPALTIVALVDGSGYGDTVRYQIQPGGQYVNGVNRWGLGELNLGNPQTLADFVLWARDSYPTEHVYLAIADHGRGIEGIAWDQTSSQTTFISVAGLRTALQSASRNGTAPLDVVHYDACLMGMVENAYQIKDYARYFIASENLGWSAFAYERYGAGVISTTQPISLARIVVDEYDRRVLNYPHTLSALDLSKMDLLATSITSFALALQENITTYQTVISSTWGETQKFDSRDYMVIDNWDEYVDLWDLADRLEMRISNSTVRIAAQKVKAAVEDAVVVERHADGGTPYAWDLSGSHGVAIYFPPMRGGWGYQQYVEEHPFAFTAEGQWDEFLKTYFVFGITPGPDPSDPGVPPALVPRYWIYLPIMARR